MTRYLIACGVASLLFVSACKKETPAPPPVAANPHAGMNMNAPQTDPANPHAGMDMNAPKTDPHAGMSGMGGMAAAPQGEPAVKDGILSVEGLNAFVPNGWKSVPPSLPMRLAQFEIPADGGNAPGEISVFFLGPNAGGVEANIQRWYGQFNQPDGKQTADVAKREDFTAGVLKATIISFTGTMGASTMPGAPGGGEKPGWMNLSAIVETPNGPVFFKGTGPEKTMKAQMDSMRKFVKGMKFMG